MKVMVITDKNKTYTIKVPCIIKLLNGKLEKEYKLKICKNGGIQLV